MDGYLLSALLMLFMFYALVFMRGMEEAYSEQDITDYKVRVMLMLARAGKGKPVDITKMEANQLNEFFKDFLVVFNEFQAKTNGKPITMDAVQATFPIDYLNEYNATIVK
jgi:hypothetical protein